MLWNKTVNDIFSINLMLKTENSVLSFYIIWWLFDFNGMSTRIELFYAERLRIRVHRTFIFTFFVELFPKNSLSTFLSNTNNFQLIHLTQRLNQNYHSGSEWTWELLLRRRTLSFPDLQSWSLTIRFSYVLLIVGCLTYFYWIKWRNNFGYQ